MNLQPTKWATFAQRPKLKTSNEPAAYKAVILCAGIVRM
jgi:hypothetical protein